jgi:hypothetical protein
MVLSNVGVRDGAVVGAGVDQQDLAAGDGRLEGEADGEPCQLRAPLEQAAPPAEAGALTASMVSRMVALCLKREEGREELLYGSLKAGSAGGRRESGISCRIGCPTERGDTQR